MSFFEDYGSCTQSHAAPGFKTTISAGAVRFLMLGDITYNDGNYGSTNSPLFGDVTGKMSFPATGGGASITVAAASAFLGTPGILPTGAATVTTKGTGYCFTPGATSDCNLTGQGLTTPAVAQFTTDTAATFTGALTAATSATLTAGLAEGSGTWYFSFSDGSVKRCTVAGTAVSWTGAVTATASARYCGGGNATFTGALTAATSGTLTAGLTSGTYLFNFSDGSFRVVQVVGTAVTWLGAVTATASVSYADGGITSCTLITGGIGATNTGGSAAFSVANWNGTAGWLARRLAQVMAGPGWVDLKAAGIPLHFVRDDHEWYNNFDFSVAQSPAWVATAGDVLDFHRTIDAAWRQVWSTYFANPLNVGNGDIPSNMVGAIGTAGVATASDFSSEDLVIDRDDNGKVPGASGANSGVVRTITFSCILGKSPMTATDNASKTMLGATRKAWLKAQLLDSKNKAFKTNWVYSPKDLFNLDNSDGWGPAAGGGLFPYITERDEILAFIEANNIPVVWLTGDRHCWHVAYTSTALGDAYNCIAVCATPLGSLNNTPATLNIGNTAYPQMIAQGKQRDQLVYGRVTWNSAKQQTEVQVLDMAGDVEQFYVEIPAGARIPTLATGVRQLRQLG